VDDGSRTRDLVLMSLSRAQLEDREEIILRGLRIARHLNYAADVIALLIDQHAAVTHEFQCRADEGDVPF
jgi:hypothetical protein